MLSSEEYNKIRARKKIILAKWEYEDKSLRQEEPGHR